MRFVLTSIFLLFSLLSFTQDFSNDTTILRIEKISSLKKKAKFYNQATRNAWRTGRYRDALEYSERGLKIAKAENLKKIEARLHNNRGVAYDYLSQYPSALKHYFAGLAIQEKVDDPKTKAAILGNIGLIYMNQQLNDKSLTYHKGALKIQQRMNDLHGISASLNNIAIIYARQGKYKKAIENYHECIKIDSTRNDSSGLGDNYNNIALVYISQKEYDRALDYLTMALEIRESVNNRIGMSTTNSNIGEVYYKKGLFKEAKIYFLRSISDAKKINSRESLKHVYLWLSRTEEKLNNYDSALVYYKLNRAYHDSILNAANIGQQAEIELNYQFNKEKEVARLKQEEKDRQYNIILIAVSSGLILILIFSILFFRKWKQTQAQQNLIEEKNELVQKKNDEITASISYAKRIQKAILPSEVSLQEAFPNHFVIYIPKDIVSGDFYWLNEIESTRFLAVADCTGHGVPGAMMSVVCHNALNRSVHEFRKLTPAEILNKTRELVISELSNHDKSVADGMDISLCAFKKNSNVLYWAGANNPLWIYRKESASIEEIKADKQPIENHRDPTPFTEHELALHEGDRVFLFSDGYQDQFGGSKSKKLMRKGFREAILNSIDRSLNDQVLFLRNVFFDHKGTLEQVDDVCVIGFEYT